MVFFTKVHGSAGCGGANLKDPRGGLAKGIPRKTATGRADPCKPAYLPRTWPCAVSTTGGAGGCPARHGEEVRTPSRAAFALGSRWVFRM